MYKVTFYTYLTKAIIGCPHKTLQTHRYKRSYQKANHFLLPLPLAFPLPWTGPLTVSKLLSLAFPLLGTAPLTVSKLLSLLTAFFAPRPLPRPRPRTGLGEATPSLLSDESSSSCLTSHDVDGCGSASVNGNTEPGTGHTVSFHWSATNSRMWRYK